MISVLIAYNFLPEKPSLNLEIIDLNAVRMLALVELRLLLTQAALCAIRHDTNIGHCYQRKKAAGKQYQLIVNSIRNRLIHRIFAIVRSRNFYQADCNNPLDKKCVSINIFV
jgi:hypothetical protein